MTQKPPVEITSFGVSAVGYGAADWVYIGRDWAGDDRRIVRLASILDIALVCDVSDLFRVVSVRLDRKP